jgi:PAS domain S-box-containing protein
MTRQPQKSPHLLALLADHEDEIATIWSEVVHNLPGTRYAEHSVAEIRSWLSRAITAAIEALSCGSYEGTEAYLRDMSLTRLEMEFDISEVTEGLLLFKEAVLRVARQAPWTDLAQLDEIAAAVDTYLRFVVCRFGHLYAEAMKNDLVESEERFRTVADFTFDWEYWLSPEGNYVYVSPSCERITGYRPDEFRSDPQLLETIVHPDDRANVTEHLDAEPVEGSKVHPMEFRVVTRGGEERWLEHVCQPVYGLAGNYLGRRGTNRDITERRRAEEALEQQVKEKAVAAERSRLARELHDSVAQALYSVTLHAAAASMAMSGGKQDVVADNLRALRDMAREAMIDMRVLMFELHPPLLQEEGLIATLQARLAAVETRAGLQTEIHVGGERRLPVPLEEELYWIAQEALNNVVKHAEAHQVAVRLDFDNNNVRFEVVDDGIGFDAEQARDSGGMGLRGIRERVQQIGGKLEITGISGEGTTLRVTVAIPKGGGRSLWARNPSGY